MSGWEWVTRGRRRIATEKSEGGRIGWKIRREVLGGHPGARAGV